MTRNVDDSIVGSLPRALERAHVFTGRLVADSSSNRVKSQSGFSIVELVVVVALIAAVLLPTEVVFLGGQAGSAVSAQLTQAVSLAAGALGKVRSVPYDAAGFSPGNCPDYQGNTCVQAVSPSSLLSPSTTVTVGSSQYTIKTYIVWVSATGYTTSTTTYANAYKQATVVVSWSGVKSGSISENTVLYPGNLGPYTNGMSQ